MSRPDPFRTTEVYSFALAPVIGPFIESLGHIARSIGQAQAELRMENTSRILPENDNKNR